MVCIRTAVDSTSRRSHWKPCVDARPAAWPGVRPSLIVTGVWCTPEPSRVQRALARWRAVVRQRQAVQFLQRFSDTLNYARSAMTSLSDRPITADDGVCRWHAAELWQTRAKLLKLNLICIISCTTSKMY